MSLFCPSPLVSDVVTFCLEPPSWQKTGQRCSNAVTVKVCCLPFFTRYRFAGQKSVQERASHPGFAVPAIQNQLKKDARYKVHHKNVRERQKDFATYTCNIIVKTAEVGFCNVRINTVQCINSKERFLQRHMQCKFIRRRIQHSM